jgi:hypothetical protein
VTHHLDPRRRRHEAPPVDALAAAVRLDLAADAMRARQLAGGPEPLPDEPPTGLLDLAAIRAAVGAGSSADVDPAAAAWLAGGADPAAVRIVREVDQLDEPEELPAPRPAAPVEVATVPEPAPVPVTPAAGEPAQAPAPAPVPIPKNSNDDPRPGWARGRHDPRSLAFGLHERLGTAPLSDIDLPTGPVLDQGQEGECVGCGLVDAVNVLRRQAGRGDLLKIVDAAALYRRAQTLDDIPGENYTGTSVLAGLKAAQEQQAVGGYLWAFGTRAIASALAHARPVIVGVPWLSGMYDTGPGGLVQVQGADTGAGHCLVVVGMRLKGPQGQPGPFFRWQNSWGTGYGDAGFGWIYHRDLAALLHGVGEAAVPTLDPQQ